MNAGPSTFLFTLSNVTNTGAPRMAVYYARALRLHGHTVHLAHAGGESERAESLILHDMREAGVTCTHVPGLARPLDPRLPGKLAALAAPGCKAVIGFTQRDRCVALLAARKLSARGVLHGGNFHKFHGTFPLAQLKAAYYRYVVTRYCDLVVCTNKIILDEFATMYGLGSHQLRHLPNFIDVDFFRRATDEQRRAARERYEVAPGRTVLVTVARLERQKGHLDLIEAYAMVADEFPETELWIAGGVDVGSGAAKSREYASRIKEAIERHGLRERVRLLGSVKDIPSLHAASDIYVHAALWGGWDLGLLEGMASEQPAIFTDCFGLFDGFEQGVHGYCVPAGEPPRFAEALRTMLAAPVEARDEMGRRGRQLICEHYSIEVLSEKFTRYVMGSN